MLHVLLNTTLVWTMFFPDVIRASLLYWLTWTSDLFSCTDVHQNLSSCSYFVLQFITCNNSYSFIILFTISFFDLFFISLFTFIFFLNLYFLYFFFFFLNNPAPPEFSPFPLHDALPI